MDQAAVGPAAAGVPTGLVRGREFGCNIKCLAQENVKRSNRQTKRNERVVWTNRRKGNEVPPLRAERRVTTYTRLRDAKKVRVYILAERMWLPCARILRSQERIRSCRLVDTCHTRSPHAPFSRVRSDARTDGSRFRDRPTHTCHLAVRAKAIQRNPRSETRKVRCRHLPAALG